MVEALNILSDKPHHTGMEAFFPPSHTKLLPLCSFLSPQSEENQGHLNCRIGAIFDKKNNLFPNQVQSFGSPAFLDTTYHIYLNFEISKETGSLVQFLIQIGLSLGLSKYCIINFT